MKYTFFLGAGASKSCGAPLQSELLKDYFIRRQELTQNNLHIDNEHNMERELATYFKLLFGIDTDNDDLSKVGFPTYEEALGLIDLAIARKESFKHFELASPNLNAENRLDSCREYLILLMASILYDKLNNANNNHKQLVNKLFDLGVLPECTFVSTNYDLLIDNALTDIVTIRNGFALDYGFSFSNIDSIEMHNKLTVPLYKMHGSLNWLYCPTCREMSLTFYEKGVIRLIRPDLYQNPTTIICEKCESIKKPIIMPPTYFKEYSNYFINEVWYKTEQLLREVDTIFFCGYSFPDADMHIKYLIKRAETNRTKQLKVFVINNHEGKGNLEKKAEKERYIRFFRNDIKYTSESFESFTANLRRYIKHKK